MHTSNDSFPQGETVSARRFGYGQWSEVPAPSLQDSCRARFGFLQSCAIASGEWSFKDMSRYRMYNIVKEALTFRINLSVSLLILSFLLFGFSYAKAQDVRDIHFASDKKTVTVKGTVGGEYHDSHRVHFTEGTIAIINLTATGGRAEFIISEEEFGEPVSFGKETNNGRTWVGRVPRTGDYFISVVAHPIAKYKLTLTKK